MHAARVAYAEAERLDPDDLRPIYSLAMIDIREGQLASAKRRLRRVIELDPRLTHAWRNLAAVCQELGLWREAEDALRRTTALDPADVEVRFALAAALIVAGRTRAGLKAYRALAAEPAQRLRALPRIAMLDPSAISGAEVGQMQVAAADPRTPSDTRIALFFALGALHEAEGLYEPAFAAFDAGNRLKRQALEAAPPGERPRDILAAHIAAARHVAAVMTAPATDAASGQGASDLAPIFIVGMPRSGSSLIEQILAAHGEITGLGETGVLPTLLERAYPAEAGAPFAAPLPDLAASYLQGVRERGWSGRGRFVDKTLENYLHVGAIRAMFPRAVILASVRDPVDTCLGCWRQLFNRGAETLYDLGEIGAEHVSCARLMDHWRAAGFGVIDVALEALTADPDGAIRRLVTKACGLAWDPACLTFWTAGHAVRTASAAQVRRPISAAGAGRWRRYEAHLQPLLDVLGPLGRG